MTETTAQKEPRLGRFVDLRIPLVYLISGSGFVAWTLVSMYFTINQLVVAVEDLKIIVNSGNASMTALTGEVALLKFRMSNAEDDLRRLNEVMRNANKGVKP
jgi:hypothetical protein